MEIVPSYGGASFSKKSVKVIRLLIKGCVNRPFFHISVQESHKDVNEPVIEQIGHYDPLPNKYNEKLVGINFRRLEHWLREGAVPTKPVSKLLGLCGYFPVHYDSFRDAYMQRKRIANILENLKITAAEINKFNESSDELSKPASQTDSECTAAAEENSEISSTEEPLPKDSSDDGLNSKN